MNYSYKSITHSIQAQEEKIARETPYYIEEAHQMIIYLEDILASVKNCVIKDGFGNEADEIDFFRYIKPQILGKLIYYNKVFRIETLCPVSEGKMYHKYFLNLLQELKQEYKEHICGSNFYRYYRSGRTDRDEEYFTRGRINYRDGLSSFVFEIDRHFSTYYDSIVSRIVANELLYTYLLRKISPDESAEGLLQNTEATKDIYWTDSKNALIELVYALHASGVVSHGKIGIRKVSLVFQILFRVPLGDIHHAFHRMKDRAGSRTAFLDHLKDSLEQYMDKDLR
jgi:hypothetical protein